MCELAADDVDWLAENLDEPVTVLGTVIEDSDAHSARQTPPISARPTSSHAFGARPMSRPTALVLAAAGTNRDHDVAFALDLAGAEPRITLLAELIGDPSLLDRGQMVVIAGGFSATPTRSAPAGCLHCSWSTASAMCCATFVAARKARDRHLQRLPGVDPHRPAARRARPQRERALPVRVGHAAGAASRCIWTTGIDTIDCPIAHGEGRYTHPDPVRSRPPARSRCATPAPIPTARSTTSPACATPPASCSA